MSAPRRLVLVIGILAALVQTVAWPPQTVLVGIDVYGYEGLLYRRFPLWGQPDGIIFPTYSEQQATGVPAVVHSRGHRIDTRTLAIQLGVTALLTGLLLLLVPGPRRPSGPGGPTAP